MFRFQLIIMCFFVHPAISNRYNETKLPLMYDFLHKIYIKNLLYILAILPGIIRGVTRDT